MHENIYDFLSDPTVGAEAAATLEAKYAHLPRWTYALLPRGVILGEN